MTQTPANMGTDIMRFARLDMHEVEELRIEGRALVVDHLRGRDGAVRAGALLTMLDSAGGVCGGLASLPDGWVVSTNLSARTVSRAPTGPLKIDARLLRKGRNNVVTSVEIADAASGRAVMNGVLTSAVLVPENGPPVWNRPLRIGISGRRRRLPPDGALARPSDRLRRGRRDGPPRHAAQSVGDPPRWRDRGAGRRRGRARHGWGDHDRHGAALPRAESRRSGARAPRRCSERRSDGTVLRVEIADVGTARVTAVAVVTVVG